MALRISNKSPFIILLSLVLVLATLTEASQGAEWPCSSEQEKWNQDLLRLKQGVESYRLSKQHEDVTYRIEEAISQPRRTSSIAETVQEILQDRSQNIASAHQRCRELVAREAAAFNSFNRCASQGSRKRHPQMNEQATVSARERETLLRELNQLQLDDAYVQYKNQQPVPRFDYSGGYAERVGGPQDRDSRSQFERSGNSQGGFFYGGYGR